MGADMGDALAIGGHHRLDCRQILRLATDHDGQASLLGPRLAESGWFNQKAIEQMVDQHESGRSDHSTPLWTLLMYDAFLRNVMNGTVEA